MNARLTFEELPHFTVLFASADNAVGAVCEAIRNLDLDSAHEVISGGSTAPDDREPTIYFAFDEQERLVCNITIGDGYYVDVLLDPVALNRANLKHEEVLRKCAAVVNMIAESDITEESGVTLYPFRFWKCPEGEEPKRAAEVWHRIAEVWGTANK